MGLAATAYAVGYYSGPTQEVRVEVPVEVVEEVTKEVPVEVIKEVTKEVPGALPSSCVAAYDALVTITDFDADISTYAGDIINNVSPLRVASYLEDGEDGTAAAEEMYQGKRDLRDALREKGEAVTAMTNVMDQCKLGMD